jgi:hypothetical protein
MPDELETAARRNHMANNESTTPQPSNIDDIVAVIDPKNEVAIRALLAFKRRLEALELESVVHRSFINKHEERIRALEAMLTGGANA